MPQTATAVTTVVLCFVNRCCLDAFVLFKPSASPTKVSRISMSCYAEKKSLRQYCSFALAKDMLFVLKMFADLVAFNGFIQGLSNYRDAITGLRPYRLLFFVYVLISKFFLGFNDYFILFYVETFSWVHFSCFTTSLKLFLTV